VSVDVRGLQWAIVAGQTVVVAVQPIGGEETVSSPAQPAPTWSARVDKLSDAHSARPSSRGRHA
jgi:hypothetical protein